MRNPDLYAQLELIPLSELGSAEPAQSELENAGRTEPTLDAPAKNTGIAIWECLGQVLRRAGRSLLNSACGSTEPRIVTKRNAQGDLYFSAYDPISQHHHTFHSEKALRIWLDRRYYQ